MVSRACIAVPFYFCSVLGAVVIVAGLYMVLWGKAREEDEQEADALKLVSQDEELGKVSVPPAGNVET
jgi:hypothetical protein